MVSAVTQHLEDSPRIRPGQHEFMKDKFCLTNLVSLYYRVTHLMGKGKAVDVVYLAGLH